MIASAKKATLKWTIAALALTLLVGCSSLGNPIAPTGSSQGQTGTATPAQGNSGTSSTPTPVAVSPNSSGNPNNPSNSTASTSASQATDARSLLLNIVQLAKQFKIINPDFLSKANNIQDVEKAWGKPSQENYVPSAQGTYATYSSHHVVFGFNKGNAIFEIRSYDSRLKSISLDEVKEVLGTPAYDTIANGQEIIGYSVQQKAGTVFPQQSGSQVIPGPIQYKIEMVFPQPTASNPNPLMDHYNVLNPQGTGDQMGGNPGRHW